MTSSGESEKAGYSGFVSLHELAGHTYEHHIQKLHFINNSFSDRYFKYMKNKAVEEYDQSVRSIYKLRSGDVLGGQAEIHDKQNFFKP